MSANLERLRERVATAMAPTGYMLEPLEDGWDVLLDAVADEVADRVLDRLAVAG